VAASQVYENPEFALRLLNWVGAATATQAGSVINYQANSLRNSLSFNVTFDTEDRKPKVLPSLTAYVVPSVNLQSCKQILKARLQAAAAFEQSFQNFLAQERSSTNWALLGNDLIVKSNNALEEYHLRKKTVTMRFDDANMACDTAKKNFEVS
jgi:ribosomal protein L16 Arg81 hydroxylase